MPDVSRTLNLCRAVVNFPDGEIDPEAEIPLPPTVFPSAIIGGTGVYIRVTGEMDSVFQPDGSSQRTFHLIYPDED